MLELFAALWKDETGQDLTEYALLLAFIAIAVVLTLPLLGQAGYEPPVPPGAASSEPLMLLKIPSIALTATIRF